MNIIKTTEENSYFALIPNCSACSCVRGKDWVTVNTANVRMNGSITSTNNSNK